MRRYSWLSGVASLLCVVACATAAMAQFPAEGNPEAASRPKPPKSAFGAPPGAFPLSKSEKVWIDPKRRAVFLDDVDVGPTLARSVQEDDKRPAVHSALIVALGNEQQVGEAAFCDWSLHGLPFDGRRLGRCLFRIDGRRQAQCSQSNGDPETHAAAPSSRTAAALHSNKRKTMP